MSEALKYSIRTAGWPREFITDINGAGEIETTRDQFQASRRTQEQWQQLIDAGYIPQDESFAKYPALSDDAVDAMAYRRASKSGCKP